MMSANEAKSIFFDLLAIPLDQHSMYIDRVCGDNETLKVRVQQLVNAHHAAGDFLGDTIDTLVTPDAADDSAPEFIGSFRVIKVLGQGGFGTVYLCEQDEPVKRNIAVKVLRPGMDTRSVLRRFEEERILLSKMNHPGIARVLDAGKTDYGQPYISMEYIDGDMITTYCNNKQLGLHARLEVFAQACQAIQHAHQKGVIHRDIKPGNVLVTEVDGRAIVKVIDFGVSKAFEDQHSDDTITRTMQLVGTPQYMSPEQASTVSSDIDTRTDVYSLGVMLYELATGLPPFDPQRLRSASVAQLERMIRDIDPQRPSSRVAKLEKTHAERVSFQHGASIGFIARQLKGEIDWVITKSMEKNRERRYPTAYALYDDVQRVLRGDVVRARPPSKAYTLRKFVSRNTAGTVIGALIFVSLVTLTGLSLGYAQRIARANDQIQSTLHNQEQVLAFTEQMLGGIDPAVARGQDTELFRTILDSASERVSDELSESPEVEVRVRLLIGNLYRSIGMFDESMAQHSSAADIGIESLGKAHWETIAARTSLGTAYVDITEYAKAQEIFDDVLVDARETLGDMHPETLTILSNLAAVYNYLGDSPRAVQAGESLLVSRISVLGSEHEDTMSTRNSLAIALRATGEFDRAKELFELVLEHQLVVLREDHPNTLKTRTNLALTYHQLELYDQAVEMNTAILEQKIHVLGDQHPSVLVSMVNLAASLEDAGKEEQSRDILTRALEISLDTLGEAHQYTLIIRNNLGKYYYRNKEYKMARELAEQSCDGIAERFGDRHPMTLQGRGNLADIMLDMGSLDDALALSLDISVIAGELFEESDRRLGMYSERLGKCYIALGRDEEARIHFSKAVEIYEISHGTDSEQYLRVLESVDSIDPAPHNGG